MWKDADHRSSGKWKLEQWKLEHYTTIRTVKIHNTDNTECSQGYGATGTFIFVSNTKGHSFLGRHIGSFLQNETHFYYMIWICKAIGLLGIYPKQLQTYAPTKIWMQMFIPPLLLITKPWRATKMLFSRWMDELWHIQTMTYYSTLKNELECLKTWENLNVYYYVKEANFKRLFAMIPTKWHQEKLKFWIK